MAKEDINNELKALQLKCDEYLAGWKRERADFLNYKKEEKERIGHLAKFVNENLILDILPILDNIYLAETHVPEEFKNHAWIEGFSQIKKQLCDFLKKEGIESIESLGKLFDPATMEVVEEIDGGQTPADIVGSQEPHRFVGERVSHKSGEVVEEVQKGYTLHGKVIRVAKVKVAK